MPRKNKIGNPIDYPANVLYNMDNEPKLEDIPRRGIYGTLNRIRKEVGDTESMVKILNVSKKILLFVTYINNRIHNLLKKEVCKNADIVESYFKLNGEKGKDVGNNILIDIKEWRDKTEYQDINVLEVAFRHKLKEELIEDYKLFSLLKIEPSSLFSHNLGTNESTIPDIKKAFKKSEVINKRITTYYKVHGYLKERRVEQQNTVKYRVLPLEKIMDIPLTQHLNSTRYMDPNATVKYMVNGEYVSKEEHDKYHMDK